jgi:hypothetical protein
MLRETTMMVWPPYNSSRNCGLIGLTVVEPEKNEPRAPIEAAITIHPPLNASDKTIPIIEAGAASSPLIIS